VEAALACSRPPRAPRERFVRYEWPCPGDLLHMDTKRYRRFRRPGYPFIADERQTSKELATHLGYEPPPTPQRSRRPTPISRAHHL
jgi:hypothetical protein